MMPKAALNADEKQFLRYCAIQQLVSKAAKLYVLSIPQKERLTLWMLDCNARTVLGIESASRKLLCFRSPLSREILLILASCCGELELRKLYKKIEATPTAIRLHVQSLMDDGYVELCQHATNKRCKVLQLSDKGWALMREFEQEIQRTLSEWQLVQAKKRGWFLR